MHCCWYIFHLINSLIISLIIFLWKPGHTLFRSYYIKKRTRGIAEILHSPFITSKLISFCTFWWRKGVSKRTALNLPWFFSYKQNWIKIFIRQIFDLNWIFCEFWKKTLLFILQSLRLKSSSFFFNFKISSSNIFKTYF